MSKINRKDSIYSTYMHSEQNINSLIDNSIRKIYCDKYGYIWIGTKAGLDRFDPKTNHFYHYSTKSKNKIPNDWIFGITEDLSGNLWIGTFKGIAKYDRANDVFLPYDPNGTLNHQSVRTIMVDRKNNLWVGTEGGGITCLKIGRAHV
jgi:ligand-binding sensor domain-containing protein